MTNTIIYPGTFDPITNGHIDLIQRMSHLFNNVIVAIAANTRKSPVFSLEQRIFLAKQVLTDLPNVTICGFEGLLIDFAKQKQAKIIVRGLRAISDFEYEFQLAGMNRRMHPEIETIFMTPSEQFSYLSASMVREIAQLGGDVGEFVHPIVSKALHEQFKRG